MLRAVLSAAPLCRRQGPDEGCPPQVPCENPKCARHYHRTCLVRTAVPAASPEASRRAWPIRKYTLLFGAQSACACALLPQAEWLRGSASTTKVFNTLFGSCAYCEVRATSPKRAAHSRTRTGRQVALQPALLKSRRRPFCLTLVPCVCSRQSPSWCRRNLLARAAMWRRRRPTTTHDELAAVARPCLL